MNLQAQPSKQVKIEWEDEDTGFDLGEDGGSEELRSLLAEMEKSATEKGMSIKEGTIVNGKVVRINQDAVIVDIGHKSEGEIPKSEFNKDPEKPFEFEIGQEVEVYLDRFEDDDGEMLLSYERAQMLRAWDRIALAYENNEIIEGKILARVKGGLAVDIGVKAFLPGSQVDLRPVRNLDKLIGTKLQFKIIKFHKKRTNIVLSRRALLEQDREKLRSVTLENLAKGNQIKGIVKNITDYGAFVDLGGLDGLLHITDMSWGRINHPSEMFEVGQEIDVLVLTYDPERQRVSLGYKQLKDDPWENVKDKYKEGIKCAGRIVSLTDYGAFVELDEGVEGLIHVSEMSWSKRVKHPSKIVQIGDEVDVLVLAVDHESRRISLGMKQIEPNPWEIVVERYQIGDVIQGTVRNVTDFGVFVGIEDGVDGLVHISDMSWTDRIKHPGDKFKKGDTVEAQILQIEPEQERFSLGIKQLTEDPFQTACKDFTVGTKGKGKVTKIADFGAFVELLPGVEGLIHVSELDDKDHVEAADVAKVGEDIEFIVISTDQSARKFSLSRKALIRGLEGDDLKDYIGKMGDAPQTALAEAFSQLEGLGE